MKKTVQQKESNLGTNIGESLTKHQKNCIDYWNGATSQLEKTSRSVLDLFRRFNDKKNYTKYERQYDDFKSMHNVLSKNVKKAIQSNNLQHMETVIGDAVKKLKDMVYLHSKPSEGNSLKKSMSEEYDEALLALTKCMTQLRKKLQIVGLLLKIFL